jgi:hypothetical protein
MKLLISVAGAVLFAIVGIASAQTPNPTVDSYIAMAKAAAGTDWAGTFLRLCIPPSPDTKPITRAQRQSARAKCGSCEPIHFPT